ncbi:hypothetical protein Q3G72_017369 [Acer saccharum]|nr:hypothetical protein Q3G72_017369 [Acer saccharum]
MGRIWTTRGAFVEIVVSYFLAEKSGACSCLLTVILPQSLKKHPTESQELSSKVERSFHSYKLSQQYE